MIYQGNGKLGPGIWTWSIPPVSTCPGRSVECEKLCYARGGFFAMPSVTGAYAANLELAKRPDFVALMRTELLFRGVQTLRIHVAGDFYDADYTRKWLKDHPAEQTDEIFRIYAVMARSESSAGSARIGSRKEPPIVVLLGPGDALSAASKERANRLHVRERRGHSAEAGRPRFFAPDESRL